MEQEKNCFNHILDKRDCKNLKLYKYLEKEKIEFQWFIYMI